MTDAINPTHYKDRVIQSVQYKLYTYPPAQFEGFLRGNVSKYLDRYPDKNGVEDLKKGHRYMSWLIEFLETGTITVPNNKIIIIDEKERSE